MITCTLLTYQKFSRTLRLLLKKFWQHRCNPEQGRFNRFSQWLSCLLFSFSAYIFYHTQYMLSSIRKLAMEITLAIIKPHVVRNSIAFQVVRRLIREHFKILDSKEIHITKHLSERFYAEHKGKFFYNRLITFMASGPSYALILQSPDSISKWRTLMGPTKVYKAIYSNPDCIRAIYGLSDTRNACHGSDSAESAFREICLLFPDFNKDLIKSEKT